VETPIRKKKFTQGRRRSVAAGLGVLAVALPLAVLSAPGEAAFPGATGKISFDSTRDGNTEIYVMNADGSNQTRLTNSPAIDRDAAFSPGGGRIAFVSDRDGNSEVYVMSADGSNQTRLTNNAAEDFQPAFSPDGNRIAFMSDRGLQGDMEIYVMNADGSGETRITNNTSFEGQPTFSPDGQRIAFASDRDGNFEIYTMNTDGGDPKRLTNSAASESRPSFSPDGSRIAFRTDRDGNGEIYVMNADGTAEKRLTNDPALDGEPAFSPDGQRIAFRSHRDGKAEIYVMNADGSEQINLTDDPYADRRPDWQPVVPPVRAAPSGTKILTGSLVGGDASSLAQADTAYYQVQSTSSSTSRSDWYGSFTVTDLPSTLAALKVTYQGSNSRSCSQTISIYDWSSGSWSGIASRKVGSTQVRIADIAVGGTPSRYVGPSGELRVSVRCTTRGTFIAKGNQLQISYQR
jgi:dipeptidyl aminopeptidase/acylaminoacyl peptidase